MRRSEPDRPSGSPRRAGTLTVLLLAMLAGSAFAQPTTFPFVLRATTTTGAKVFQNPTSPSSEIRNMSESMDGWYGAAVEILIPLSHELSITASVEWLRSLDEGNRPIALGGSLQTLPVRDGYDIVPVEIGVAAGIPISEGTYRLLMSGGLGVTFASRIQEIAGVKARNEGLPAALGIFVGVAFEVRMWPGLYGHLSTRFRDPETNVTTRFTQAGTVFDGRTLLLPTEPSTTRINLDGLSLSAGIMVDIHQLL